MLYAKRCGRTGILTMAVSSALALNLGLCLPKVALAREGDPAEEEAALTETGAAPEADDPIPEDESIASSEEQAIVAEKPPAPGEPTDAGLAEQADPTDPAPLDPEPVIEPVAADEEEDSLAAAWDEEDEYGVQKGWVVKDGWRYYYDENGFMFHGLCLIDRDDGTGQDLYYFDEETGVMQTGWLDYDGKRFHFDEETGRADKGRKTISGKEYYFASDYGALTGIAKIGKQRYAFTSKGILLKGKTGIRTIGGKKYYVDDKGRVLTGFKVINGKRYAFVAANDGAMAKTCLVKNYIVAWNGVCHKIPAEKGGRDASVKRMTKLIAKCITPKSKIKSKKDLTRVREAADYIAAFADRAKYTMKGSVYYTAYGVFYAKRYSCAGTTRALGAVLTQMKIKWQHVNPNQYAHQWCKVRMDGKWGWADSDIEYIDMDWDTGKELSRTVTGAADYGKHF